MAAARQQKPKTAAEIKQAIEKKNREIEQLQDMLYANAIEDVIAKSNIVQTFHSLQEELKDVGEIALLKAIGKAVGIKRLVVGQSEIVPRKKRAKKDGADDKK